MVIYKVAPLLGSCGSGDMLSGAIGGEFAISLLVAACLKQPARLNVSLISFLNDFGNNQTCLLRYVSSFVHMFYIVLMLSSELLNLYFRLGLVELYLKELRKKRAYVHYDILKHYVRYVYYDILKHYVRYVYYDILKHYVRYVYYDILKHYIRYVSPLIFCWAGKSLLTDVCVSDIISVFIALCTHSTNDCYSTS